MNPHRVLTPDPYVYSRRTRTVGSTGYRWTSTQSAHLVFLAECIASQGYPPTLREIGDRFGMTSTNAVAEALQRLERKGAIRRVSMLSRAGEGSRLLHVGTLNTEKETRCPNQPLVN